MGTIGAPLYRAISADYVAAAKLAEVSATTMQATTWLTYRALYVNASEAQTDLFAGERPGKESS